MGDCPRQRDGDILDPVEFDGYKLREVTEADYPALEQWIAADPAHAAFFEPDFFLGRTIGKNGEIEDDSRATCYALEDESGVLFYIRMQRAARVFIQFPPPNFVAGQSKRLSLGLVKGMAFLEVGLARAGAAEWIFASESPRLRKIAVKALGFGDSPTEMIRPVVRLSETEETVYTLQRKKQEGA